MSQIWPKKGLNNSTLHGYYASEMHDYSVKSSAKSGILKERYYRNSQNMDLN